MTYTSEEQLDLAWTSTLIPCSTRNDIHADYHVRRHHHRTLTRQIRPLARTDYARGHLDLLAVLTTTPDVGEAAWQQRYDEMKAYNDTYYPIVIVRKDSDRIVACGTVMLERKFIRGNGIVGHIEDIATAKECQGRGLGKRIIEALTAVAFARGACALTRLVELTHADKVILDCNKDNIPFYQKCGYIHKEYEMVQYADASKNVAS